MSSIFSGTRLPTTLSSITATGARPHEPRQYTTSKVAL